MNENQHPRIETDDVEGHGTVRGGIIADDVEGHGTLRGSIIADDEVDSRGSNLRKVDDVEGHGVSSNRFRPDEEEMFGRDVEGHGVKGPLVDEDDDDTEGHRTYATSDVTVKHDVAPVESEEDEIRDHTKGFTGRG